MDRRVVVSGGAGFLGSHLCERLVAEGWRVLCLDSLLTGARENLRALENEPRFEFQESDVTEFITIPGDIDWIMHFASPASPVDYMEHPIHTLKVGALGTLNLLGVAKAIGAGFFLASTSEVYGDPKEHPQPESYWGNVNPIGPRGCYDEAKRFAEAMTFAYHRTHSIPVKVVRIFNSILADQTVIAFDENGLHIEPIEEYADRVQRSAVTSITVPAFDPQTMKMEMRSASALIKHVAHQEAFEVHLRYGRKLKVTGDHSVFVRADDGSAVPKPVREIEVGDHVAIPARLPVIERDRTRLDLVEELEALEEDPGWRWMWSVWHPDLSEIIDLRWNEISDMLLEDGHYAGSKDPRHTIDCQLRLWRSRGSLPLPVFLRLGLKTPQGSTIGVRGSKIRIPALVDITTDLLWLAGFYLAEGAEHSSNGTHFISMSSDTEYLLRAKTILQSGFGIKVGYVPHKPGRAPSIYAHSRVLHEVFCRVLDLRSRRIPPWVMELPLSRAKHFLEGFRCGDGTHSGKKIGNELCFDTTSESLAIDLNYLLLRFGIVASFGHYETTFKRKYGDRRFPFFRLTVCEVDDFDILSWDAGVKQTLNAVRVGDLVWAKVRAVTPCIVSGHVYDFSVPGHENFVAGNGVSCHNTYGPRLRRADGRAVPNFINQALTGMPLTVHGDGSQTRSLCYVDDEIEGIFRLLVSGHTGPMNIGNPEEVTVLELAEAILQAVGGKSQIRFIERPIDDPEVRKPDITQARKLLGWEPQIPLSEGLARTITWSREAWR